MTRRRKTITVKVSSVPIGSSSPIVIQSMTKLLTTDIDLCIEQINCLAAAGCRLVRLAVPTKADTAAFAKIVPKVNVPLVADVHFSPDRAIEAIQAGAAKIRLNPGNIKNRKDILRIIDAAKIHGVAVRIGVNEASIRDLKHDVPTEKRVALMLKEMKKYVRLFESRNFTALVLSAKSSNIRRTVEINRRIAQTFDYPIHLGLTHAGLPEDAVIPSAIALGTLLLEGIGDTVRVSAAGDPVVETEIAKQILISLGLYERSSPELIVCPTCGRTEIDVVSLARQVKQAVADINQPLHIAVMGCIVNGPGEAADADLALCAAKNRFFLYRRGRKIATVPENEIIPALLKEIKLSRERLPRCSAAKSGK
jgi:(E)-4-hydroxy-3-methylbut-2-enyl-diphosphate synthase